MRFEDAIVGATVKLKDKDGNDRYGIITSVFLDGGGGFTISLPDNKKISLYKEHTNDIPIMDMQVVEYKGFGVGDRVKIAEYGNLSGESGVVTELFGWGIGYWAKIKLKANGGLACAPIGVLTKRLYKISIDSIANSKFRSYTAGFIKGHLRKSGIHWNSFTWNLTTDGKLTIKVRSGNKEIIGGAKCHPDDKFDICAGVRLAVYRIKEQLVSKKWKPKRGDIYWALLFNGSDIVCDFYCYAGSHVDQVQVLLGNCFKTKEEAQQNAEKVRKRYKAVKKFLKGYDNE